MRRKWVIFLIFCMAGALAGCSGRKGGSGINGERVYADKVEAETYSIYAIPIDQGAVYQAYDPKEQPLELLDGRFAVGEPGDYFYSKRMDGETTWHMVSVRDTTAPRLKLGYGKKYAKPGSTVALPSVSVTDSDGTVDYEVLVTKNGAEVPISEAGFLAAEKGEYTISVSTADKSGNTAEKTAVVVCTSDEARLNCIYEMDTVFGLEEQTIGQMGIRLQLTDEEAPDKKAAAKLKLTASRTPSDGMTRMEHMMFFRSPFIYEWKDNFSGIYFWIRNISDTPYYFDFMGQEISFALNDGNSTTWLTREMGWQKVEITELDKFLTEDDSSFAGMIDMNDCVGMYLGVKQGGDEFKYGEVLISSVYGIPKTSGQ